MRAKRSLGQNFLVDPNLQRKVVAALEAGPGGTVIEIGPGRGALTDHLAETGAQLLAVEKDDALAADLAARFADHPRIEIVHADILEWEPPPGLEGPVGVVGNIPYNITSPILFRVLAWRPPPRRIVLTVQKEVADRLVARPGEKAYGALTVGVRAEADVERLFDVGRRAFRPVPNVDSTVVRLDPVRTNPVGGALQALTRAAFGMRRKQLQKILRTAPGYGLPADAADAVLESVGLRPRDRPEVVDPPTFIALARALRERGFPTGSAGDGS